MSTEKLVRVEHKGAVFFVPSSLRPTDAPATGDHPRSTTSASRRPHRHKKESGCGAMSGVDWQGEAKDAASCRLPSNGNAEAERSREDRFSGATSCMVHSTPNNSGEGSGPWDIQGLSFLSTEEAACAKGGEARNASMVTRQPA